MITTGRDCGSASWIKKEKNSKEKTETLGMRLRGELRMRKIEQTSCHLFAKKLSQVLRCTGGLVIQSGSITVFKLQLILIWHLTIA